MSFREPEPAYAQVDLLPAAGHARTDLSHHWLVLVERIDRERHSMDKLARQIAEVFASRTAVTSLEYAIIAGVLATVLFAGMNSFGNNLSAKFALEAAALT